MRCAGLAACLMLLPAAASANPSLDQYYNSTMPQAEAPAGKAPVPAADESAGGQSQVVTSVQKCFDEIGRDAAREIRSRSLTPYADCQKRLREQAAEKKKAAAEDEESAVAETPRNYRRVTGGDGGDKVEDNAAMPSKAPVKKPSGK